MQIAITGATGFLGWHLTTCALSRGWATRGVVRTPSKGADLVAAGATMARADLGDEDALAAAFEGVDVVVANAALGSGGGDMAAFEAANIRGTENVVRAAARAGVRRLVQVSTVGVYRVVPWTTVGPDRPLRDESRGLDLTAVTTDVRYARTKTRAERRAWALADELGLPLAVVRPGPIIGSRDTRFTDRVVQQTRAGVRPVPTIGLPLSHAGDIAAATLEAATRDGAVGRAVVLAGPPIGLHRVYAAVRDATGGTARILPVPAPLWTAFDTAEAEQLLGYTTRTVDAMAAEVAANHPGVDAGSPA